jgi:hypothetical protein
MKKVGNLHVPGIAEMKTVHFHNGESSNWGIYVEYWLFVIACYSPQLIQEKGGNPSFQTFRGTQMVFFICSTIYQSSGYVSKLRTPRSYDHQDPP